VAGKNGGWVVGSGLQVGHNLGSKGDMLGEVTPGQASLLQKNIWDKEKILMKWEVNTKKTLILSLMAKNW
jgi:hypothetical protein